MARCEAAWAASRNVSSGVWRVDRSSVRPRRGLALTVPRDPRLTALSSFARIGHRASRIARRPTISVRYYYSDETNKEVIKKVKV